MGCYFFKHFFWFWNQELVKPYCTTRTVNYNKVKQSKILNTKTGGY